MFLKNEFYVRNILIATFFVAVSIVAGLAHLPLSREVSSLERQIRALDVAIERERDLSPFLRAQYTALTSPQAIAALVEELSFEEDPRALTLKAAMQTKGRTRLTTLHLARERATLFIFARDKNGVSHLAPFPPSRPELAQSETQEYSQ